MDHDDCTYPVITSKRNVVLILNNTKNRPGTEVDSKNMKELWKKITDEDPIVKENLVGNAMFDEIEKISEQSKNDVNYIVIIISSRGGLEGDRTIRCKPSPHVYKRSKGGERTEIDHVFEEKTEVIVGNDGQLVNVIDILRLFDNDNAPDLIGIPKFFIFQFGRGRNDTGGLSAQFTPKASRQIEESTSTSVKVPEISDMLVAYSTHAGYSSGDQAENGSRFIAKIKRIFEHCYTREHVVDMLTRVNAEMEEMSGDAGDKAMSKFESSLRKRFYLCTEKKRDKKNGNTIPETAPNQ